MHLRDLQDTIEQLHDIQLGTDVSDYLVDDALRRKIPGAIEGLPEQLFVRDVAGETELALYIAPSILTILRDDDPRLRLHRGNLEPTCVALEGVSHFVLLAWRASVDWPVSALEMEIQAEVDKFIATWTLLVEQGHAPRSAAEALSRQLFDSYVLRDEVVDAEQDRYVTASRVAQHFCRGLATRHARRFDVAPIRRDARTFYRLGLAEKMQRAQVA